jgi:2Fe-2S ferredoxin
MVAVTFITRDGAVRRVEGLDGQSAMQAAVAAGIAGIVGECGGACSCATCHVHVAPAWRDRVGEPGPHERALLDFADDVTAASRLACQIVLTRDLDGLVLGVAA